MAREELAACRLACDEMPGCRSAGDDVAWRQWEFRSLRSAVLNERQCRVPGIGPISAVARSEPVCGSIRMTRSGLKLPGAGFGSCAPGAMA